MSRLEQITAKGQQPSLPPAGPAAHLIGYLFEAGPTGPGAMGATVLSHVDIAAWQANTGTALQAWEAKALRRLSAEYLAAGHDANDHDCPPFWAPADAMAEQRDTVARSVRSIFGAMANTSKKGMH